MHMIKWWSHHANPICIISFVNWALKQLKQHNEINGANSGTQFFPSELLPKCTIIMTIFNQFQPLNTLLAFSPRPHTECGERYLDYSSKSIKIDCAKMSHQRASVVEMRLSAAVKIYYVTFSRVLTAVKWFASTMQPLAQTCLLASNLLVKLKITNLNCFLARALWAAIKTTTVITEISPPNIFSFRLIFIIIISRLCQIHYPGELCVCVCTAVSS